MNFQDTLTLNIKVIIAQATSAISKVEQKLAMMQRKVNLATKLFTLGLSMDKFGRIIDPITSGVVSSQELMQRMTVQTASKFNQSMRSMRGNMMSVGFSMLFGGMALKRLGEQILTSLVKTYMQATDEQSKFNQELLAVQASFEFLKFSIMDALGNSDMVIGFIEALINMVNWVSEFVNKHTMIAKLVGLFLIFAIIGGALAMVLGQCVLGIIGIMAFAPMMAPVLGKIAEIGLAPILTLIGAIIAGVVLLWAYWQTNFGNIRGFTTETFGIIFASFADLSKKIWGALQGVFKVLTGFLEGDFSKVMEGVKQIVGNVLGWIVNNFIRMGASIANVFIFIFNGIREGMLNALNIVVQGVNSLLSWITARTGGRIVFPKLDVPDFVKNILAPIDYITAESVKTATGAVDDFFGLNAQTIPKISNSDLGNAFKNINPLNQNTTTPFAPTINIENMFGNDAQMKKLFDGYMTSFLEENVNKKNGVTTS